VSATIPPKAPRYVDPFGFLAEAVIDVLPDVPGADRRSLTLYALGLLVRTSGGQIHPFTAYQRWFAAAGLTPPRRAGVGRAPARAHQRPAAAPLPSSEEMKRGCRA